jgi:hypothetical protein
MKAQNDTIGLSQITTTFTELFLYALHIPFLRLGEEMKRRTEEGIWYSL